MLMSFSCYMPLILPVVIKPPTTQQTLSSSKKVIRFIILCRCVPIYFQTFRFEYKIPGAIEIWKWSPHQHASNTRDDRQEIPPQRDLERFEGVEATTRHRKGLHSFWTALDNHRKAHEITLKHLFAVYNEDRRPQKDTSSSPLHACPTDASFQGGFLPVSSLQLWHGTSSHLFENTRWIHHDASPRTSHRSRKEIVEQYRAMEL